MKLGVCYYPEHWPESQWPDDARRMAEMGLSRVRIGEFAWAKIEPRPGTYDWGWLDRAVEILADAGLEIVMGTPTATPPKWLVDTMPEMVALDAEGRPRGFGSRRHYCFSHGGYAAECDRIVAAMAERYGRHPAVAAWQTDNEYGCHDTAVSYSGAALANFRRWLAGKYDSIDRLNEAWGNVFWSMEYGSFNEIDLPNLTVTVPNPSHELDFRRFASDEVATFNRRQVDILRLHSPGRDIVHNFMGFFTQFDHHAVAADLDVASWDSYPLGFLEQYWFSAEEKRLYERQGHPDIAAFHHDLYRGCMRDGRWWVMEQQPGPVNWARFNPSPLPGMVRLWTLEAMAHGAELVSFFRWRQCPFGQEQMHSGLLRPDGVEDIGAAEVRQASAEMALLQPLTTRRADAAILFDYQSAWVTDIELQAEGFSALRVAFEYYGGLRRAGLDVDILPPHADFSGYRLLVIPCMPVLPEALVARIAEFEGEVVIGARSGAKTENFSLPSQLPPGPLQTILPIKVARGDTRRGNPCHWIETVETELPETRPGVFEAEGIRYVACYPAPDLDGILADAARDAGLAVIGLPEGVRLRRFGDLLFAFNYAAEAREFSPGGLNEFLIGSASLLPAAVSVCRIGPANSAGGRPSADQ